MPKRVQHPKVHERKDRGGDYWFFRYRHDELLPDGMIKTTRKFHTIAPSRGEDSISKKQAEGKRDIFLAELNAAATRCEAAVVAQTPPKPEEIIFGKLADLWRKDYVDNPMMKLATPTREKYRTRLDTHILPRWKDARLSDLENSKAILDWLQHECTSWHMMIDLRNIMSGIITRAQEWGIIPRSFANPLQWVRVGRKWAVRDDRILSDEETVAVFARLTDPHLLICETCIYTGTRISEAVGTQLKHLDLRKGTLRIAQRHCRGDVDVPKTESSKRLLALGALTERYAEWIAKTGITRPDDWLFPQDDTAGCRKGCTGPRWDSGTRKALKQAAAEVGCDFPGFGLHSFRRANITLRQAVGGSSIEASKIAGHSNIAMTGEYTKVQLERQDQLTRAIQDRIGEARMKQQEKVNEQHPPEGAAA